MNARSTFAGVASVLAATLVFAFTFSTTAHAWSWWGYRATFGVGDWGRSPQYYWIDSSAAAYVGSIDGSMSDWIWTRPYLEVSTPICLLSNDHKI